MNYNSVSTPVYMTPNDGMDGQMRIPYTVGANLPSTPNLGSANLGPANLSKESLAQILETVKRTSPALNATGHKEMENMTFEELMIEYDKVHEEEVKNKQHIESVEKSIGNVENELKELEKKRRFHETLKKTKADLMIKDNEFSTRRYRLHTQLKRFSSLELTKRPPESNGVPTALNTSNLRISETKRAATTSISSASAQNSKRQKQNNETRIGPNPMLKKNVTSNSNSSKPVNKTAPTTCGVKTSRPIMPSTKKKADLLEKVKTKNASLIPELNFQIEKTNPITSTPATSTPATSTPATSTPATSTPATSTPAASTPKQVQRTNSESSTSSRSTVDYCETEMNPESPNIEMAEPTSPSSDVSDNDVFSELSLDLSKIKKEKDPKTNNQKKTVNIQSQVDPISIKREKGSEADAAAKSSMKQDSSKTSTVVEESSELEKCNLCPAEFKTKLELKAHNKESHGFP